MLRASGHYQHQSFEAIQKFYSITENDSEVDQNGSAQSFLLLFSLDVQHLRDVFSPNHLVLALSAFAADFLAAIWYWHSAPA